jgi:putative copper export protein
MDLPVDVPATALRGASVACLLSLTGTILFRIFVLSRVVMPEPVDRQVRRALKMLSVYGLIVGLAAHIGWLVAETASMADAHTGASILAALPLVLFGSRFGYLLLIQCVMLPIVAFFSVRKTCEKQSVAALLAASFAVAAHAGHGHLASMSAQSPPLASLLLLLGCVHIASAAGWVGSLIPLALVVRIAPPSISVMAARWYTPMGKICLGLVTISAFLQGMVLIAPVRSLWQTDYGLMASVKAGLTLVLTGFAVANRYWFTPSLTGATPQPARNKLLQSLVLQTFCGISIVVASSVLSSLPPPMPMSP